MIQTSEACVEPTAQSSFTDRVFFPMRMTSTTRSATRKKAEKYRPVWRP
jgi:hypothetical protein